MMRFHIDKCSDGKWLTSEEQSQIIAIIAISFRGVDAAAYFAKYFIAKEHYRCCVRLFYQDSALVGYCLLTFSKGDANSIMMGASAAFLPVYRGSNNTFAFSMKWAVKTWLLNLHKNVYYLDTMLSPAMYRAMGKRVAYIYPNPAMTETEIAQYQALVPEAEPSPWFGLHCLKTVGRSTNYTEQDIKRLTSSSKTEIAFYCKVNPDFASGVALMVLIPINLKQLLITLWKAITSIRRHG